MTTRLDSPAGPWDSGRGRLCGNVSGRVPALRLPVPLPVPQRRAILSVPKTILSDQTDILSDQTDILLNQTGILSDQTDILSDQTDILPDQKDSGLN